ncbi:Uncharacterized protein FWK35_00027779, partial [Aphis craccivora]
KNKHVEQTLSSIHLARAENNKKRNLSESPRKFYPSPESRQPSFSQEIWEQSPIAKFTDIQKYSPLKNTVNLLS